MGELHKQAMDDLIRERRAQRGKGPRTRQQACAVAWRIAQKYAPQVARHTELTPGAERGARAVAAKLGCDPGSALFAPASFQSGAWEPYAREIERLTAPDAGNVGHPSDVANIAWAIVDRAAADGISQADLDLLAGVASITVSSAYQWYDYEMSGGWGGDGGGSGGGNLGGEASYEVTAPLFRLAGYSTPPARFAQGRMCGRWCAVGWADLGGAVLGAIGGGFAGAVLGGAVESAVVAFGTM